MGAIANTAEAVVAAQPPAVPRHAHRRCSAFNATILLRLKCVLLPRQDTGLSFTSPQSKRSSSSIGTPGGAAGSGGSGPTPSKLLLMHGERQMNMLGPEQGNNLFQVSCSCHAIPTISDRFAGDEAASEMHGIAITLAQ